MQEAANICFDAIVSQSKRPLFVAITGDAGSGKSHLVSLIAAKLKKAKLSYTLIDHDEFLISRHDREPMKTTYYTDGKYAGKSHWEILENMFRLDEYKRVIDELKAGKTAKFHPYSRETGTVGEKLRVVRPTDFVIFDTSMLKEETDFVILVDVGAEELLRRKLTRDKNIRSPEQIAEMHWKVQNYYWEDRGKPTKPDIVIDNNDFKNVRIIRNSTSEEN